jgi:hypothetical protein
MKLSFPITRDLTRANKQALQTWPPYDDRPGIQSGYLPCSAKSKLLGGNMNKRPAHTAIHHLSWVLPCPLGTANIPILAPMGRINRHLQRPERESQVLRPHSHPQQLSGPANKARTGGSTLHITVMTLIL